MPATPSFEQRLAAMDDDALAAVELATLDPAGQDALLREVSRRARDEEVIESRRADIAFWKIRGRLLRLVLVALLAVGLTVAYKLMN